MQSHPEPAPVGAADLRQLTADLAAAEHHLARAVVAAGRLAGSGVCERVEGLPLELFIGLAARMTGADRNVMIGAGQVLEQMPVTAQLFLDGKISWGQVRRIARAARTLRVEQRMELDEQIAASHRDWNGVDAYGPDQLCDAVDAAADDLRTPRSKEQQEAAAERGNFLSVQRTLFNRVQFYGDYDEVSAAPIVDMLDAQAGQPHGCGAASSNAGEAAGEQTDHSSGSAAGDNATASDAHDRGRGTSRGRQFAQALAEIAAAYLAGGLGAGRARNLINVHVDLGQCSVNSAGMIQLNVRGPIPRISLATLEILSRDADVRAVIFDGKRPLAVSRKLHAKDIPDDVAFAVGARDMGDRWPGSNDPLGHTDNHHITWRSKGGVHHVDDLVRLSRRYHRIGHDNDWQMHLDPATAMFTIKRGNRVWRSLPRGTPLSQATGPPGRRTRVHPRGPAAMQPAAENRLPF